jgi:hypothetical protein
MKKAILSFAAGAMLVSAPAFAATETTLGGDIILRPFYRDNARDFDSNTDDTKRFLTERTRVRLNAKVSDDIDGFVEFLHFRKWGSADPNRNVDNNALPNTNSLDDNWLDLNQAYINVKNLWGSPISMRAGRQEMAYGDQRLIGNTNFWSTYPFPRAYDALKLMYKSDAVDVDLWTAKVTEREIGGLFGAPSGDATGTDDDRDFHGIWATLKNIPNNTIDLYLLNMVDAGYGKDGILRYEGTTLPPNFGHFPYAANTGETADGVTNVYNLGARVKGKAADLDYTLEVNKQFGEFADEDDIDALGYAAVVGYTIPAANNLRISAEYVHADGDSNPTDGDHETFYQFTPAPHPHLGAQDFFAFQNVNAWRLGASIMAAKNLKISADYWNFELDEKDDLWYSSNLTSTRGASGAVAGRGGEGILADEEVGSEVDVVVNYTYNPALTLELGYSVFMPGDGIKDAGAGGVAGTELAGHTAGEDDNATFAWAMLMLKF